MKRRTSATVALAALACVSAWGFAVSAQRPANTPASDVPAVDEVGPQYAGGTTNLMRPANYREWVFLSSSLGLTYQPAAGAPASPAAPQFQNVFVNRSSYRGFMQTGKWPDRTIFVLEFRQSAAAASVNKDGRFQSGLAGIEAEVKDARFPDGWAFYAFDQTAPPNGVAPLGGDRVARCIECHTQHTAVERTFVQFYPTLLEAARRFGTVKPNYTDP
jgi:hypothetical protein